MEAYCVKCRAKREMKDPKAITMKNGKPATQGVCPTCGTKMFRIGKGWARNLPSTLDERLDIRRESEGPAFLTSEVTGGIIVILDTVASISIISHHQASQNLWTKEDRDDRQGDLSGHCIGHTYLYLHRSRLVLLYFSCSDTKFMIEIPRGFEYRDIVAIDKETEFNDNK